MKCPYKYKHQLVDWAVKYANMTKYIANQLTKSQLYAIYYKKGMTNEKIKRS